jgi:hypothetical protein
VSWASVPRWRARSCPPPAPPHLKRAIVADYVKKHGPTVFVETGTYRGDTLARIQPLVSQAISIELDPVLASAAKRRFRRRSHVEIRVGDSAVALPEVVAGINEPALYWLDGHFSGGVTADSGESPVLKELEAILASSGKSTILVDDARLFDGTKGYPTLDEVVSLLGRLAPTLRCTVSDDIIRVEN